MRISVIIVSYRAFGFLEQCLYSVSAALKGMEGEVFVVDNQSGYDKQAVMEKRFPFARFTWLNENLGFAKANNLALAMSTGDFVLFVNPDVILPENFFQLSLQAFQQNPGTGALGYRMYDGSGRFLRESKRGIPTPFSAFCRMSGLSSLFPRSAFFSAYYAGQVPDDKPATVDVLAGACMMISRKAAELTGGFDERYFMYAEDIDLSVAIKKAGMQNRYLSHPAIIHFKGESTSKLTADYIRHFYGAMRQFVDKHYHSGMITRAAMRFAICLGQVVAFARMQIQKTAPTADSFRSRALVIGSQEALDELIPFVARMPQPFVVAGRVSADRSDNSYTHGHLDDLSSIISHTSSNALILCPGDVSAENAIRILSEYGQRTNIYFHFRGSSSLVGSPDSGKPGLQVVID